MLATLPLAAVAQSAPEIEVAGPNGSVVPSDIDGLLARARRAGRLPVLVELAVDARPEGLLEAQQRVMQRVDIAKAQQGIADVLGAASADAARLVAYQTIPYLALHATAADLARIARLPVVRAIVEDVAGQANVQNSMPLIGANKVWRRGFVGTGWAVAVLDSGVDTRHPAIGNVVAEACYSTNLRVGGYRSLCPDGVQSSVARGSGRNCNSSVSGCDHGTYVAGIAMGFDTGHRGVAFDADLIAMQVFSRQNLDVACGGSAPCTQFLHGDVLQGLERVALLTVNHRIAAVNLSLTGIFRHATPCDTGAIFRPYRIVIANLRALGVAVIAASGNDGEDDGIKAPACTTPAIAVGATETPDDPDEGLEVVATYSNHAAPLALLAPGSDIRSSVPGGGYAVKNGTSMAAPHVTGAWALMKQAHPEATVDDVLRAFVCTGTTLTREGLPRPRIDVAKALRFLDNPPEYQSWNFSRERHGEDWRNMLGSYFLARPDQVLRATGGGFGQFRTVLSPFCGRDVVVQARMRRMDPDPSLGWNSGLLLSAHQFRDGSLSGLFFAFNNFRGGEGMIISIDRGRPIQGTGSTTRMICRGAAPVLSGDWNVIRAESVAGRHTLRINGQRICTGTDTTHSGGFVGLAMGVPGFWAEHILDTDYVRAANRAPSRSELMARWDEQEMRLDSVGEAAAPRLAGEVDLYGTTEGARTSLLRASDARE